VKKIFIMLLPVLLVGCVAHTPTPIQLTPATEIPTATVSSIITMPAYCKASMGSSGLCIVNEPGSWAGSLTAGDGTHLMAFPDQQSVKRLLITLVHQGNGTDELNISAYSERIEDEWWGLQFQSPVNKPLVPGHYPNAQHFASPDAPTIAIGGNGRGCGLTSGAFTIRILEHMNETVTAIDMDFEQHCEKEDSPLLHGTLRWKAK
jgi:hypothetical protein